MKALFLILGVMVTVIGIYETTNDHLTDGLLWIILGGIYGIWARVIDISEQIKNPPEPERKLEGLGD